MRKMISDREIRCVNTLTTEADFRHQVMSIYETVNARCALEKYHAQIIFGARTKDKQLDLYAKGREKTSVDPAPFGTWMQTGRIVTRALPEQSAHCYRAAADLALVDDTTNEWLHDDHPAWGLTLAFEVKSRGLESGHYWHFKDSAHMEIHAWRELASKGVLQIVKGLYDS